MSILPPERPTHPKLADCDTLVSPPRAPRWRRPPVVALMHWTTGQTWALPDHGEAVIGTLPSSTVALEDRCVSRRHLTLIRQPRGRWFIQDQSRNGTKVNGQRVLTATVETGDVIAVGDTYLLLLDQALVDGIPTFDALLGTAPLAGYRPTCALLQAITEAPLPLVLTGPHQTALELVAAKIRGVAALPLRWVDCPVHTAGAKVLKQVGITKTEAERYVVTAARLEPNPPDGPVTWWPLMLGKHVRDAEVYCGAHAIQVPVRGLDERFEPRAQIAARIYAARPELHAHLRLDALERLLVHARMVDIAEAWGGGGTPGRAPSDGGQQEGRRGTAGRAADDVRGLAQAPRRRDRR